MTRGNRAVMTAGHGLNHIDTLGPPHFSYNNPVWPHPHGTLDQVPDAHLVLSVRIGIPGFKLHQIGNIMYLKLRRILNRNYPFILRYISHQRIEHGRFSRTRTAGNKYIVFCPHDFFQKCCCLFGQCALTDQTCHTHRLLRKFPYREYRPV